MDSFFYILFYTLLLYPSREQAKGKEMNVKALVSNYYLYFFMSIKKSLQNL